MRAGVSGRAERPAQLGRLGRPGQSGQQPGSSGRSGLTVVEALLAMAVLAVAMSALAFLQVQSLESSRARWQTREVTSLLASELLYQRLTPGVAAVAQAQPGFGSPSGCRTPVPSATWSCTVERSCARSVAGCLAELIDVTVVLPDGSTTTARTARFGSGGPPDADPLAGDPAPPIGVTP